jgi:hypothetical protein
MTSGKDSPLQSVPAVLKVLSKGMINGRRLTWAAEGTCWADNGAVRARSSSERTIPTGFLKISRL